jgi:adenosylcobinamide kinase/adenosylcobinamide-phosphate guanylyltransferase
VRTLVLGGIRSGKSRWAESAIAEHAGATEPVHYVATGAVRRGDAEWSARIAAHRARRPSHWRTVETTDIAAQLRTVAAPTLIDDVGGWLTAAMERTGAFESGSVSAEVDDLVEAVRGFGAPLVLVSPEVGLSVVPATAAGRRFADELGALNQRLAAVCEQVTLVVAGQPITVKGPQR